MPKKIVLDAGHGGTDPGAVNGSRHESDDVLKLAKAVKDHLLAQGQTVVMTRSDDVYVSLTARTDKANLEKADLFVSLHRNSFSGSSANGVEIWVYTTAGAVDTGASTEVLEQLVSVGVQNNRGIKKGNYHVLRESNMPSMLVELGFISNPLDNQLFDQHFDAYALAIAKGICAALGEAYSDAEEASKVDSGGLYRVQVGAFRVRENAQAFLEQVRQLGLEAFLVSPESL